MKRLILLVTLAFAQAAYAEPVVLAVDGKDIYVDVGAKDGVGAGSELELLHEIVARDPKSGATLRDRFALGTITVIKSGNAVSVAHAEPELAQRVLAGDRVRLVSGKRAFVDPWEEQVAASKGQPAPLPSSAPTPPSVPAGPPVDHATHVNLAREAWQDTLGKSPAERIERWKQLLAADPQTPYRRAVEVEIASLTDQIRQREDMLARARSMAASDRNPRIAQLVAQLEVPYEDRTAELLVSSIERAVPGRPIQLAFLARRPGTVRTAWLYARPEGAAGFTRTELVRDGDAYMRGTIDGSLVRGDRVDWYVEVASVADGEAEPVLGSQTMPRTILVDDVVAEGAIEPNRTHIDAHVDYVDFDGGFNDGFDQYYQAEMDFTYRFLTPVYAVRVGFGTLSGKGGPKDVIDEDTTNMCRDAGGTYRCAQMTFSYVYTEAEFRIRPNVALMVRPQAGILTTDLMPTTEADRCRGRDISDCAFDRSYGFRGRLRLGAEDGTNLVLGAAFTSNVGTLLEAAYHWLPNKVVPVQITVQVTDQPVLEDFGVRLIADVGVRRLKWFYPSARVSYQARDIDHSGFGAGVAFNFDW